MCYMQRKYLSVWSNSQLRLVANQSCFGFWNFGACRRDDFVQFWMWMMFKDYESSLIILLSNGKSHKKRSFTISDDEYPLKLCYLYQKYTSLQPSHKVKWKIICCPQSRQIQGSKCLYLYLRKSSYEVVAKYLKLGNPNNYTGHSLWQSSASMSVEGWWSEGTLAGNCQV